MLKPLAIAVFINPFAYAEQGIRVTETSVTETGGVLHSSERFQTRGFGITYVSPVFLTATFTSLNTESKNNSISLEHNHLDFGACFGSTIRAVFSYGIGVSGKASLHEESLSSNRFTSTSYMLGPGFKFSFFEVTWLHRTNFLRYSFDDQPTLIMTSSHSMLGLAVYF